MIRTRRADAGEEKRPALGRQEAGHFAFGETGLSGCKPHRGLHFTADAVKPQKSLVDFKILGQKQAEKMPPEMRRTIYSEVP